MFDRFPSAKFSGAASRGRICIRAIVLAWKGRVAPVAVTSSEFACLDADIEAATCCV